MQKELNLVQFFGGISSKLQNDNELYSSNIEQESLINSSNSTLVSNTNNENSPEMIGIAVFKDSKLVGELSRIRNSIISYGFKQIK